MRHPNSFERLRGIAVLATLSDDDIAELASCVIWRRVKRGRRIVELLHAAGDVYFIAEGQFSVEIATPAGEVVHFRDLSAGAHFGEIALLAGTARTAAVLAETDGVLGQCRNDAFLRLLHEHPCLATAIITHLARTVVALSDRVFALSALEVRFRLYAELLRIMRQGQATEDGVLIENAPTHQKIAIAIGAQREVVTRELRLIAKDGIVHIGRRELLVRQPERLRRLVEHRGGAAGSRAIDWRL